MIAKTKLQFNIHFFPIEYARGILMIFAVIVQAGIF